MTADAELIGFADPVGKGIGFLIPVFDSRESNALLVQRLDRSGRIAGFDAVEALNAPIAETARAPASSGEEAIWAFAFAADDILAERGTDFRTALRARIDDAALAARPLLSVEVAEFLEMPAHRILCAKAAYDRLHASNPDAADTWRDLSILTPDLRREAEEAGGEARTLSSRLIARANGDVVTIQTSVPAGDDGAAALAMAARAVLDRLPGLYDPPRSGWAVRFRHPERASSLPIGAAVLLQETRETGARTYLEGGPSWGIDIFPASQLEAFREAVERGSAQGFVVIRGEGTGPALEAASRAGPNVIVIQLGRNARYRLHDGTSLPGMHPWLRRIYVPATGLVGFTPSSEHTADTIRQVVAGVLEEHPYASPEPGEGDWVFFRASGTGHTAETDAIAALYDRLLANDLSGKETRLMLDDKRGARATEPYAGWAREVLFPSAKLLHGLRTRAVLGTGRSHAAVLLPIQKKGEREWHEHRRSVEQTLSYRGWRAEAHTARIEDEMPFEIDVPLRLRYLLGRPEAVRGTTWDFPKLLNTDLRDIEVVALTGNATAANILVRMHKRGQLAINMRDLCASTPEGGIWSLLGAQVRRLASGQMQRARTHFMAVLLNQGFRTGRVDFEGAGALEEALNGHTLGDAVQLSWRKVRQTMDVTTAEVRLHAGRNNFYLQAGTELIAPFRLVLHEGGIAIEGQV